MGMNFPLTFGGKIFLRLFMPGLLLALAFTPAVNALFGLAEVPGHLSPGMEAAGEGIWIAAGLIFFLQITFWGWLIAISDLPIYMVYEGRRYWPKPLHEFYLKREQARLRMIQAKLDDARIKRNEQEYNEMGFELRHFPVDADYEYYAPCPTRLGNLIASYEQHSLRVYGLDAVFYWYRVWMTMSNDIREEVDIRQAFANSTVYISFCLCVCAIVFLSYALLETVGLLHLRNVPSVKILFLLSFVSALGSRAVYSVSLYEHMKFGEIFKSVFDIFGSNVTFQHVIEEIVERTGNKELRNSSIREKREAVWSYLQYYRIKDPSSGKFFSPSKLPRSD